MPEESSGSVLMHLRAVDHKIPDFKSLLNMCFKTTTTTTKHDIEHYWKAQRISKMFTMHIFTKQKIRVIIAILKVLV